MFAVPSVAQQGPFSAAMTDKAVSIPSATPKVPSTGSLADRRTTPFATGYPGRLRLRIFWPVEVQIDEDEAHRIAALEISDAPDNGRPIVDARLQKADVPRCLHVAAARAQIGLTEGTRQRVSAVPDLLGTLLPPQRGIPVTRCIRGDPRLTGNGFHQFLRLYESETLLATCETYEISALSALLVVLEACPIAADGDSEGSFAAPTQLRTTARGGLPEQVNRHGFNLRRRVVLTHPTSP